MLLQRMIHHLDTVGLCDSEMITQWNGKRGKTVKPCMKPSILHPIGPSMKFWKKSLQTNISGQNETVNVSAAIILAKM